MDYCSNCGGKIEYKESGCATCGLDASEAKTDEGAVNVEESNAVASDVKQTQTIQSTFNAS